MVPVNLALVAARRDAVPYWTGTAYPTLADLRSSDVRGLLWRAT